jgi:pimeloyl-ACP methyl ester carboxylesterase
VLTRVWDVLDDTTHFPCPVIGASVGGMFAAELAIFRPEAVTKLALLAPLGIFDAAHPGIDLYAMPGSQRLSSLFAGPVPAPFETAFAELATNRASLAIWRSGPAPASSGRFRIAISTHGFTAFERLRSCCGAPTTRSHRRLWPRAGPRDATAVIVNGAGHLLEWDAPELVAARPPVIPRWMTTRHTIPIT